MERHFGQGRRKAQCTCGATCGLFFKADRWRCGDCLWAEVERLQMERDRWRREVHAAHEAAKPLVEFSDTSIVSQLTRWMKAEVKQLQAIVAKLPKTADGVRVVPGMTVYHRDWNGNVTEERTSWAPPYPKVFSCCYDTREAAETAREEG